MVDPVSEVDGGRRAISAIARLRGLNDAVAARPTLVSATCVGMAGKVMVCTMPETVKLRLTAQAGP